METANRVAVVGSRSITRYETVKNIIEASPFKIDVLVTGGADGVDTCAEEWAERNLDREPDIIEPNYRKYGPKAPLVRNTTIVESSDAVIAVWDGESTGTRDTIDKALHRGTALYVEVV